ncbi:MAG TPA: tetratricopeptide repeat protein [Candidatus Eremiobacteraceae bacterium]|nr:tetratricopeptide repeat protein [Candidatus Eremiobacteraceae bacterium]
MAVAVLASLLTFAALPAVASAKAPAPAVPSASPPARDFAADIATAKQLQRQGRARDALAMLAADHKLDPANRDVTVAYAQISSYAGDQGLAIALLDQLLQASPDDADARIVLAQAYAFNHDYASAESQYQVVLKAAPADSDAQVGLGETYTFEGRYDEAKAIFATVLSHDPKNTDALVGRADAESFSGDYHAARADYEAVIAAQPDDTDALVGLATVDYWLNDLPQAVALDNRALALDPGDSDAVDLHRQLSILTSPQLVSTLTTSHSSDGSTFDFRLAERFFTTPTTAFGIIEELYRISDSQSFVQTKRFGIEATVQPTSRLGATLSLLGSQYGGVPSVTDSVFSLFGSNDGVSYGAGYSVGGVDGSVAADGGQTNVNGFWSPLVRISTVFGNVGYTHRANTLNVTAQSGSYNDGNRYHELTFDVSRSLHIGSTTTMTPDLALRNASFSETYTNPPQGAAPGYYNYYSQRDITLSVTANRQLSDRFAIGAVGTLGERHTIVPVYFNGPKFPPVFLTPGTLPFERFEPFFDYEGDRFSVAGAYYDDHYTGGPWVLPYDASTIDLTFSIRMP